MEKDSWTNQLYKFGRWIFDEPQHINRQSNSKNKIVINWGAIAKKLKHKEVRSNVLFNIFFQILPSGYRKNMVEFFCKSNCIDEEFSMIKTDYIESKLNKLIQPDVMISSQKTNIFLEIKTNKGTLLEIKQIIKYVIAMNEWKNKNYAKNLFLILLTPNNVKKQWCSKERKQIFKTEDPFFDLKNFIINMSETEIKKELKGSQKDHVTQDIFETMKMMEFKGLTWQEFGDFIKEWEKEPFLKNAVKEYLDDLEETKIWKRK